MASAVASIWQGITYRGKDGHYAWLLHRAGGLGIVLFLFLHILDIFLVGVGEDVFEFFLFIYHSPPAKVFVMALLFGVFFHAFNGVRIILVDFWPDRFSNLKMQRTLFRLVVRGDAALLHPDGHHHRGPHLWRRAGPQPVALEGERHVSYFTS